MVYVTKCPFCSLSKADPHFNVLMMVFLDSRLGITVDASFHLGFMGMCAMKSVFASVSDKNKQGHFCNYIYNQFVQIWSKRKGAGSWGGLWKRSIVFAKVWIFPFCFSFSKDVRGWGSGRVLGVKSCCWTQFALRQSNCVCVFFFSGAYLFPICSSNSTATQLLSKTYLAKRRA